MDFSWFYGHTACGTTIQFMDIKVMAMIFLYIQNAGQSFLSGSAGFVCKEMITNFHR